MPWSFKRRMLWYSPLDLGGDMNPVTSRTDSLASLIPGGQDWTHQHYTDLFSFRSFFPTFPNANTNFLVTETRSMVAFTDSSSSSPSSTTTKSPSPSSYAYKCFSDLFHITPNFEHCSTSATKLASLPQVSPLHPVHSPHCSQRPISKMQNWLYRSATKTSSSNLFIQSFITEAQTMC